MPHLEISHSVATGIEWLMCRGMIQRFHYLHTFPDPRCNPLVYSIRLCSEWIGSLVFGRPESNRCYQGELTYGSLADRQAGKCRYDRWEVLNLARVWLVPSVQPGGSYYGPERIPGFVDRKGVFRSTLASSVIDRCLTTIGLDYLLMYPPCFLEEPYQVRVILSYCDTRLHRGVIYRASGFHLARKNREGVETWWTDRVESLSDQEDEAVRSASRQHSRSQRLRGRRLQEAKLYRDLFGS